ncbi:MAG: HNH endonuclease, partial [Nocardioides sp.]|nr:HNH endonuclease [Nocardioides sp.]
MFQPDDVQRHPVLAAVSAVEGALGEVAEVDPIYMATDEKAAALLGLSSLLDRVEELRMRVLATADDVAAQQGARDAAAWLAHRGRRDRGECRRRLRLARALA